jgi:hypothetical protein
MREARFKALEDRGTHGIIVTMRINLTTIMCGLTSMELQAHIAMYDPPRGRGSRAIDLTQVGARTPALMIAALGSLAVTTLVK